MKRAAAGWAFASTSGAAAPSETSPPPLAGIAGMFAIAALGLLVRFAIGVAWLFRGLADLGAPEVIEGEVVKMHNGRVAVDDGRSEEIVAWTPPPASPALRRGMVVRIAKTRRLHYVSSIEVMSAPPRMESGLA